MNILGTLRWKQSVSVSVVMVALVCASRLQVIAEDVELPRFEAEVIDAKVSIGYGIAIGDVDGDKKPDIILADKKQFVWYQNPTWKRFVLAENLTPLDNVCIAARDIDGDGQVEIAVGGQWNPGDTNNSGAVFYLDPPRNRTEKWTAIQLPHEPTVHRMRWVKLAAKKYVLVVAPLHGRGNRGGQGAGVKLLGYHRPADPREPWVTKVIDDSLHVTHNLDPCQWDASSVAEEILYVGREGALLLSYDGGAWIRERLDRVPGGGEIRMGLQQKRRPFVVTIEPLHGTALVYYSSAYRGQGKVGRNSLTGRVILDDKLNAGHAIATADLFGNGRQQIVAGWRSPNANKKVGVKLYYQSDDKANPWKSLVVDDNRMATEDLRIADLNGDGRVDIIAAGRATHNLKVYWNREQK